MTGSMNRLSAAIGGVKGSIIPLATAAVPLGAALAPIAVKAGAASLAVAAFGAAVAGQAGHLSDASKAQEKYNDAVAQHGRGSKQAAEAQRALSDSLASMPQATARAAVAMGTLKSETKGWSDELASFTMVPVEKSFTLLGQLLPKLTPMVKGASSQLDRLVTVAGGAMASPGFDKLSEKISTFANESLQGAVDGIIHFSRALSEGTAGGPVQAFMEYAEANGPALRETLGNMADAVSTLVEASADAGPGMLTLVNAAANLVASLPPELVTVLMQTAVALKLVTVAGAGAAAVSGGIATLGARITALSAVSTAAGGGLAGLKAAFLSLGTAAKASIVVAGVAAVAVAFGKLAEVGREAPPNVEKLTTSLGQLGRTGKASGEAARLFGSDLDSLYDSVRNISDPSTTDKIQQGLVKVFSLGMADSTPHSEAEDRLKGIDEGLTNLVRGGKADMAAAAFARLSKEYVDGGGKAADFKSQMDGYNSALADVKFEQDLAADSMGVFGAAAQSTSATLEAQRQSADGLRASILALNDTNRSAYDAQIGFEASLDSLSAAFEKNGATLDLNTEAGRANGQAMSAAAKSQDEFIAAGVAAGESLGSMTKKSSELRESMMALAIDAFDGNKKKAEEYVNTLLGVPSDIATLVKLEREEAITGLEEVRTAIQATPDSHEVTVSTLNGAAIAALEAVGLKTEQLPDGSTRVYTANGQSLGNIGAVSTALNNLNGRTANTYVVTTYKIRGNPNVASGTYLGSTAGRSADGNIYAGRSYADGGMEQHVAQIAQPTFRMWAEPETGGEAYIPLSPAKRPRSRAVAEETVGILGGNVEWFAGGGLTKGQMKGLSSPSDMSSLKSTLSDVRSRIKDKTSGGTEARLLRTLDSVGKKLMAHEKSLTSVNKALDGAKDKLKDLKSASSQLSSSVKSGVLSAANITSGNAGKNVTVGGILQGLTDNRDKATAFSKALTSLKSKGLSSSLIRQIAEAGIEGGGLETAGALMTAGSNDIKAINSLQGQITSAATAAGKTTADTVYGQAIKAQTAATSRLQKSQDKLEATMASLAKNLDKVISRAPGKKAAGGIIGGAASGGVRGGLTWVGEQGPELLDLPAGARVWSNPDSQRKAAAPWASMLNAPRRAGGATAVGGAQTVIVHQTITLDGKVVAQQTFEPLRELIRGRGGNVQNALGQRDR